MQEDTKTAKVLIGDIEGNHQKFSHYIELKPEDYVVEYGNYVRLTDEGRKRFSGTHRWWDVNYHNYSIELCDKPKEDNNAAAKEIGKKLKMLKVERGLTSAAVCEKAGIKAPTLTAIENGYYNFGIRQTAQVAAALGAHIEIVKDEQA